MIILGIDPGFGITGYGLIEVKPPDVRQPNLIEAGVLRSKQDKSLSERLHEIHTHLFEIIKEYSPEALAVEDVYSIHAFPRSAIYIGNVQGIVLLAAAQKSVPVFTYFPIQVKKALLGYGRATKTQVQHMVQRTLGLNQVPKPDDVADALAVALCHANRI